jgi:hypothetical protein
MVTAMILNKRYSSKSHGKAMAADMNKTVAVAAISLFFIVSSLFSFLILMKLLWLNGKGIQIMSITVPSQWKKS